MTRRRTVGLSLVALGAVNSIVATPTVTDAVVLDSLKVQLGDIPSLASGHRQGAVGGSVLVNRRLARIRAEVVRRIGLPRVRGVMRR